MIRLINNTQEVLTYFGQCILVDGYYDIQPHERSWMDNQQILEDISNDILLFETTIISPRQMRIALILSDITSAQVEAAIAQLGEPDASIAIVAWEYSIEFDRESPMVDAVGQLLGLTTQQVDDLWTLGKTL